jgi:carboxypeptidase Taq
MGITDELTQTIVGSAPSMGVHESQSRFFENIIGKSYEFWKPIYERLRDTFHEQLDNVPIEQFIKGINKVEPGPIRTEADELTYTLHIMIRYEIEKLIFQDKIKISDLPKVWNDKYKEYLFIEPANNAEGILQDIHWACGDFGYFPSYAIGNAVAAQIYYHMKTEIPFDKYLTEGNIAPIVDYLKEYVHKFGATKNMNEILQGIMKEDLNVDYYIRYLKEKYAKIYNLEDE